jgi:PAS domain S-box-containing protein
MEVAERGLLALRTQRARAAQHSSSVVIALGSLLGVIFLSIAGMAVNREIGVSARGRAQVKALNAGLEERVEQRSAALLSEVAVRKRIEETRERLAAIVDSSDDAIISKTLDGTISAWNRGAEKVFGYRAAEAVGKPMLMLLPPERIEEEADILARIAQGHNVEHFETVRVCKDGKKIDVSVTISPIRDGEGRIVGASKVARDITERKRAEDALRDSEERLRLALEGGRLGSWQWKLESDELDGSPLSFALFGLPADTKFNFAGFRATLHPDDRMLVDESMRRCLAGEAEYDVEYRAIWPDGTERWIAARGQAYKNAGGEITHVRGVVSDVTDRRQAQEALRESETNFGMLVDLVPQFVWICTNEGLNIYFNDRWLKYTGLTLEQSYGTGWNIPFHPEEKQKAWDAWNQATATGDTYTVESRLRAADGSYRWFLVQGQPLRAASGRIVKWFGTCTDIHEMKRALEALQESEERFQVMANGIQQLAWMAEADGSIFWYNQRWYDYTGTTLGQTEGWTWEEIHDPAVLPEVLRGWRNAIATGMPFDMEFPLRGADGSFRMFLTRVMPVRNAEGAVVRWLGTNTDISERKKAEEDLARLAVELGQQAEDLARSREDLEEQSSMLKLILESMGEGLIAADAEGHFLLWNDAANTLMGRGAADLPPEQWTPHYAVFLADGITACPADRLPLVQALRGESVHVELMIQPPEPGAAKFIEVTARPLKDALGTLRGGVAVLHDITERKQSEAELTQQTSELALSRQALEAQKLMLQSVLNSMVEGLVAADEQGKFILWNAAADKIMGLGPTNLPSTDWGAHYGLFLPDTITPIPPGETPLERTLRGETGTTEIFLRHAGLDAGLWLEATGSPLRDKDGVTRGGVLAFRDISRRKTDELEIRKLNEGLEERIVKRTAQLETANHELEAFSYSVSHDLRAPLRHIGGFSRILMNDFGSVMAPEAKDHLQHINDAVLRMGMLVDGLLSLAKLGRQSLRLRPTDLNVIVAETISVLQPECEGREVEWRVAPLPTLECDGVLMGQVFQNLLGNALKYSRGRTKAVIEVGSIQQAGKPAVVFVRDNGAGFNMQYAEKLFGVFQRMHTEAEFEGTGVGLATVQRIVQKHGGSVWAEAETDHGATFYFTLGGNGETKTAPRLAAAAR